MRYQPLLPSFADQLLATQRHYQLYGRQVRFQLTDLIELCPVFIAERIILYELAKSKYPQLFVDQGGFLGLHALQEFYFSIKKARQWLSVRFFDVRFGRLNLAFYGKFAKVPRMVESMASRCSIKDISSSRWFFARW